MVEHENSKLGLRWANMLETVGLNNNKLGPIRNNRIGLNMKNNKLGLSWAKPIVIWSLSEGAT